MEFEEIINELEELSNPGDIEQRAAFGINHKKAFGVKMPELRRIAKITGKNHELAGKLWNEGYGETRILASLIDDPNWLQKGKWKNGWLDLTLGIFVISVV